MVCQKWTRFIIAELQISSPSSFGQPAKGCATFLFEQSQFHHSMVSFGLSAGQLVLFFVKLQFFSVSNLEPRTNQKEEKKDNCFGFE